MIIERKKILKITNSFKISEALHKIYSSSELREKLGRKIKLSIPPNFLLHGSLDICEKLEPNISDGGINNNKQLRLIYATDNPDYAIFLAIIELKDSGRASVSFDESNKYIKLAVNLQFVNGQSQIKQGYVHILDRKGFTKQENREFTNDKVIEPLFAVPVEPEDLQSGITIKSQ